MTHRLPRIALLATGGTIAGLADDASDLIGYRAAQLGIADLLARMPALDGLATLVPEDIAAIDSKDATPAFWQAVGQRVQAAVDDPDIDAVVLTHGTDTLEETAWYLQLTLRTRKPVVLTGAMRPASAALPDGPQNLADAVRVAADPRAAGRGVLVVMNARILAARRVAKQHTTSIDAFGLRDDAVGAVYDGATRWRDPVPARIPAPPFSVQTPLAPVDIVVGYAGCSTAPIDALVAEGVAGLVWAGTGNGAVPTAVASRLRAAVDAGVVVVRASRSGRGAVTRCAPDDDQPFLHSGDLDPGKSRVLLMLALGAGEPAAALQGHFDALASPRVTP
ncbi:asparaginase [Pigmentiphaga litoralis]|uniref:L-asparaginase n=1 Tax=Pigmentiphaga litoralis TaxID=516702 RepID=A0A7Y9LML8_9BURK|nr:asparaginase [Pigmentiphaga litoralis]NYE23991.1 L-asparaginase [Pigmentiphaga litoralis]NYE82395.1 L-asparaginase [Pigmentiphaga litoralis]